MRPAIFSSEQCMNPKGECIVMWQIKGQVHCFLSCTLTKSYQSLTSFIHIIKETIMECLYFEILLNYQNPVQYDHPRPKWIMLINAALICACYVTLHNGAVVHCQISINGLKLVWFAPVPQQLPLATFAHTY